MNFYKSFAFFIIIGCLLVSGCITQSNKNTTEEKTSTSTITSNNVLQTTNPVPSDSSKGVQYGQLNVTIGNYNANLPVLIDGMTAGNVSPGKPLSLKPSEGNHQITVCVGKICEKVNVEIGSSIKTTIDFEERLKKDVPQGSMSISIGDYLTPLPAFIDGVKVGIISPGKMLNQTLGTGNHSVEVCVDDTCIKEIIDIKPSTVTSLSFERRLKNDLLQGSLRVSISGYNAELPVLIDNISVGMVTMDKPLNIMVNQGNHTVTVCVGKVCEKEDIQVKFAKQISVDFGERLKKDAEFPTPTVRIVKSAVSGNTITVDVEFINPDNKDHSMTATILCVYSVTDSQNTRKNDSAQRQITNTIKAGERVTQQITLSLSGGSNPNANAPVVTDMTIK